MAGKAEQAPEAAALDRVGQFFGDMAAVAQKVWDRNLTLWSTVSNNVRSATYGADAMANDAAKTMAVAIDNLDDIWTFLTRVPEREHVAAPLPTAFLFFALQPGTDDQHTLAETVWIRLAPAELEQLPQQATIGFSGPQRGADALERCLRATLVPSRGYRLETYDVVKLVPGVYSGLVYVGGLHPRPLANLRVVVEGTASENGYDSGPGED
jgi:hypothetical protein